MERHNHRYKYAGLAALLLLAAGCRPTLAPSKPASSLTPAEQAGESLFVNRCQGCHYSHTDKGLHGPGLFALYRKPYLPSGAPANDDRVAAAILRGRNMMPAFANTLDEQQLEELLAYLRTL